MSIVVSLVRGIIGPVAKIIIGKPAFLNPSGYILLENGDKLILEDGSGNVLLEG